MELELELEGTYYRDAILYNYKQISKNIKYDEPLKQSFKDEEVNRFSTKVELSEGERLVRYILSVSRYDDESVTRFLDALKVNQKPLTNVIEETKSKVKNTYEHIKGERGSYESDNLIPKPALDVYYRDGILYNYNDMTQYLKYDGIIGYMVQYYLVTIQEKQDIDALNLGSISKNERLLEIILNRDLRLFEQILKKIQKPLADAIDQSRQKIVFGEVSRHLDALAHAVKEKYHLESFYKLERLPGESFILDISNDHGLLTQDISVLFLDKQDLQIQRALIKEENLQYSYIEKETPIDNIENVFIPDPEQCENLRLVLCTGDAGIGKSVTLRRLAWQWSAFHESLKQFKLLFVIALGKIDKSATLLDILSDSRQGMGYVKNEQKNSLHEIFQNSGEIVLIAIDADGMSIPSDSDLARLISGELYPRVKVIVFCRPEANITGMKGMEKADAKITINGTDDNSIVKFISALCYKSYPETESGKNIQDMLDKLTNLLPDKTLLYIPLYLTILAIIFDTRWVKQARFSNSKMPTTMTQLFNAFINVIITKWQSKAGATDSTLRDFGTQNPMDVQSSVPVCILAKLFNIGRMSLDLLEKQQFYVTEDDLKYFLIELNDIRECGLFAKKRNSNCGNTEPLVFYYRHQLFQEYLAALYLSRIMERDSLFKEKILKINKEPVSLEERFKPLQDCVKFLFGLNPTFGSKILSDCMPNTALVRSIYLGQTEQLDLVYESEIIRESNEHPEVLSSLQMILTCCSSKSRPVLINNYENAYSVLFLLCRVLSEKTAITLLKQYYLFDVNICKNSRHIVIQQLDITCFGLLSQFKFPQADEVTVSSSLVMDFHHLQKVFPNVRVLEIEGQQLTEIPHSSEEKTYNSLKRLQIVSKNISRMPLTVVQNLLKQHNLEEIIMNKIDLFSNVKTLEIEMPKFGLLTVFEYKNIEMHDDYKFLFFILKHIPNLKRLILHSSASDKTCTSDEADLFRDIVDNLSKLQHMELSNILPTENIFSILKVCCKLPDVEVLGFDDICVIDNTGEFDELINNEFFKKLKTFKVFLDMYSSQNFLYLNNRNIHIEYITLGY